MTQQTTQNIKYDRYDHAKFRKLFFETDLKKTITGGVSDYPQFSELTQDLFYTLFKYAPQHQPPEDVKKEFHLNRQFIDSAIQSPAYQQLRAYSKLNANTSALSAATLGEQILKENADTFDQLKQHQNQMQKYKKQLKKMAKELKNLKNSPNTPQNQKMITQLQQKIRKALNTQKTLQKQTTQTAQQISLYSPLKKTADTIKSQEDFFNTGIGSGSGGFTRVPFKERLAFSKVFVNNKHFRRLLKMLGKMKRLAVKNLSVALK